MKKLFIISVVICMLITNAVFAGALDITTDTSFQPAGTTNLALGKTATGSSSYEMANEGWGITFVNDGKVGTTGVQGWTSSPYDTGVTETTPAWVQIDLGEKSDISRVVIWPRQDLDPVVGFPVDYTIQISDDGENWTTIATETNQNDITKAEHKFDFTEAKIGRYIRMHCTKRTVDDRGDVLVQLAEMAVYGVVHQETAPETSDSNVIFAFIVLLVFSAFSVKVFANKRKLIN